MTGRTDHDARANPKLLPATWRERPRHYSRGVWPLLWALDALPYPLGEDLFAHFFVAKAFVRTGRLRQALAWAARHAPDARSRWRLALACCGNHGRFLARTALVGVRGPAEFRRQVVLRGEEHIGGGHATPTIFLALHLGPPKAWLALRVAGYPLTWVGGWSGSRAWQREAWLPFRDPGDVLSTSGDEQSWLGVLYRARRILLAGGAICITADGGAGREAFRVDLPSGPVFIRAGWLNLRRQTGARVLPVLTHMEDRAQVLTIHRPLPPPCPDLADDTAGCLQALRPLLAEHVRRHPEQCYTLAFPPALDRAPGMGGTVAAPGRPTPLANREPA